MTCMLLLVVGQPLLATALAQTNDAAREERQTAVANWVDSHLSGLVERYKHLHANPELSFQEKDTAAYVAGYLREAGYTVTTDIGRTGLAAVLENRDGPTVLIRTDLDALPIYEQTGLPYASKVEVARPDGGKVGVMHACGHDIHMTMLMGTAELLSELRDMWHGTVVLIGQPAEELGSGARAMIEDRLFERVPKPDYCLALHVKHDLPADTVGYTAGWAFANVDSVDIIIYGQGGHGARPHQAVDPIVAAAAVVTNLQTLVSRRIDPVESAVVTVGSIHGGSKHNIIPDSVKLQLTVRSYTDEVRRQLLHGIKQIAIDTCRTYGCPRSPDVTVLDEHTPASFNDPQLTALAVKVFKSALGDDKVLELPPEMGGEDFGVFARKLQVPGLQYRVGVVAPGRAESARNLPSVHSSRFAPLPEPTIRTSVVSMCDLALALWAGDFGEQ